MTPVVLLQADVISPEETIRMLGAAEICDRAGVDAAIFEALEKAVNAVLY